MKTFVFLPPVSLKARGLKTSIQAPNKKIPQNYFLFQQKAQSLVTLYWSLTKKIVHGLKLVMV